jgi:hypothetical protein
MSALLPAFSLAASLRKYIVTTPECTIFIESPGLPWRMITSDCWYCTSSHLSASIAISAFVRALNHGTLRRRRRISRFSSSTCVPSSVHAWLSRLMLTAVAKCLLTQTFTCVAMHSHASLHVHCHACERHGASSIQACLHGSTNESASCHMICLMLH